MVVEISSAGLFVLFDSLDTSSLSAMVRLAGLTAISILFPIAKLEYNRTCIIQVYSC